MNKWLGITSLVLIYLCAVVALLFFRTVDTKTVSREYILDKGFEIAPLTSGNEEFFYAYRPHSDAGTQMLFRYDPKDDAYIELRTAFSYLDSNDIDHRSISPDGTRFLSVLKSGMESDEQTLYLVDLRSDSAVIVKSLAEEETFVAYHEDFAAYPVSKKEWIDDETVKVTVFDATQQVEGRDSRNLRHPELRTETIAI
ncbi:hypothetical protein C4568_01770 [Candidatus Parcubacteria bacterium]|nr:MAG: hypothetical protein C4568_01770 [Candidatus Parcubacteria bacterium]